MRDEQSLTELVRTFATQTGDRRNLVIGLTTAFGVLSALSLIGAAAGAFLEKNALATAGTTLFQPLITVFIILLMFAVIMHAAGPMQEKLRRSLFEQVEERVRQYIDVHVDPSRTDPQGRKRPTLHLYQSPVWFAASLEERAAFSSHWRPDIDDRDQCLYWTYTFSGHDHPVMIVSLWQFGKEARLGVFFSKPLLDQLLGEQAADHIIEDSKRLFLRGSEGGGPFTDRRHSLHLVEDRIRDDHLLSNAYQRDFIAIQYGHLVVHTMINLFEAVHCGKSAAKPAAQVAPGLVEQHLIHDPPRQVPA